MDEVTVPIAERPHRPEPRPPRQGLRWGRAFATLVGIVVGLALLALLTVWALTSTDWGRERVRRYAVKWLGGQAHGQVHIGKVTGNLLRGAVFHDVVITDSAGKPFVAADSVSAKYRFLSFFDRRIFLDDVVLARPLIVLDKPPGGEWNWKRIFPRDTTKAPGDTAQGFGDWIRLTDVTVLDGRLVVRSAWTPSSRLTKAQQDSAIRDVMSGKSRLMVERVPGGYQKIIELRDVFAELPLVRLADPDVRTQRAEVKALRAIALPFRPPAAEITALTGNFDFTSDSVWWRGANVHMPGSHFSGDGMYVLANGDMWVKARGRPAALADMRWVFPRIPSKGGGPLDFAIEWKGAVQEYYASNMDIRTGGARVRGTFGITLADTFTIHKTDVTFAGVDTRLIEQVVPGFDSPRRGVLAGKMKLAGGKHAMVVNGDVAFDDRATGTSRAFAQGEVGMVEGGGFRARKLRVRVDPLQVALVEAFTRELPVGGVVVANGTLDGNTNRAMAFTGDVLHRDRTGVSRLEGRGSVQLTGERRFALDAQLRPLSLNTVGAFAPSLGLGGAARGHLALSGTMDRLRVDADLALQGGGEVAMRGTVSPNGANTAYDVAFRTERFDASAILKGKPETRISATGTATGRGFTPATMSGRYAVEVRNSRAEGVSIDWASFRGAISGGLATIERLELRGPEAHAVAEGSFGLVRGRSGTLRFNVDVADLGALDRFVPGAGTQGSVAPRPGILASRVNRARADSARIARATEVERAVTGRKLARIPVDTPRAIPRAALAGSLSAAGTLTGNIHAFDAAGRAAGEDLVVRGNAAKRLRAEFAWTGITQPKPRIQVRASGDSLSIAGFSLDTAAVGITYAGGSGDLALYARQGADRDIAARTAFTLHPDHKEVHIAQAAVRIDTVFWRTAHATAVRWGGAGIRVNDFELINDRGGRIFADGLLPTEGSANLRLAVRDLNVRDVLALVQSDVEATGLLNLEGRMTGTLAAPRFNGAMALIGGTWGGTAVPNIRGTLAYAGQELTGRFEAMDSTGHVLASAEGMLPVNLALSGVTGPRLLERGVRLDVAMDSIPLDLIPRLTDLVTDVTGRAVGRVAIRGLLKRPEIVGAVAVVDASARVAATGMHVKEINGMLRLAGDTAVIDSLTGRAHGPISVRGGLGLGNWRTPSFALFLQAQDAQVLDNEKGTLRADIGLALTGPFDNAYLAGQVTVRSGVVYIPKSDKKTLVGAGDPALFAVIDTSVAAERELMPGHSPLLRNLRMDVDVAVERNTWVRSRDMNVEIYTDGMVHAHVENEALALTGTVSTDRGEYELLSKRFQIRHGSAMFIGTPELNPTVQAIGEYEVRLPSSSARVIQIVIGGTARKPTIALQSDAQPPLSQSDILSFLAFGRESSFLLDIAGSVLTGSALSAGQSGTTGLEGVSRLAARRLASVALSTALQEAEGNAARSMGIDVFNVRPADIPDAPGVEQIQSFLAGTEIEAGKYVDPRTFVAFQGTLPIGTRRAGTGIRATPPGVRVEHRAAKGWRFEARYEPRYLLKTPSLSPQLPIVTSSFGAVLAREWRF